MSFFPGVWMSISGLAAEFGMTRETVAKRLDGAGVRPTWERGGYPVYRLRDVLPALTGAVNHSAIIDPDTMTPFQRQAHFRAELDKLKLEEELSELIPAADVDRERARALAIIFRTLALLPEALQRDCDLPPDALRSVRQSLDGLRAALSADLPDLADDDEPPTE